MRKIVIHPLHHRVGRVFEVDGHTSAHRRTHLVHQSAELAKVDVFGVLANLGDGDGIQLVPTAEMVEDIAHQRLIGGGGGQPGPGQHRGGGAGIKAGQRVTQLRDFRRHPPHQGGGGVLLLFLGGQVVQGDLQHGVALGLDAHHAGTVGGGAGQHIHIHAGTQYPAVLMVGVVAADLRAAGAAEQGRALGVRPIPGGKGLHRADGPRPGLVQLPGGAVQGIEGGQGLVMGPVFQSGQKLCTVRHRSHLVFHLWKGPLGHYTL